MSVKTCPRCRAEVHVAEGTVPACPSCGLGARDAPAPAPAPPAAGGPRRWMMPALLAVALTVLIVAAALLVGLGGGEGTRALSQEEAEETARLAMADVAADAASATGGDLRSMSGSFSMEDGGVSGTLTIDTEWGRDGTGMVAIAIRSGATEFGFETYCFPDRNVVVFGDEAYEARPHAGETSCWFLMMDDAPTEDGDLSLFQLSDEMHDLQVTPHADGTVTATFSDGDGNHTLHVDARGRATRIETESPDGGGAFDITYGARRALTAPETSGRIPSDVDGFCIFHDGTCSYPATGGGDAPLSDFEVRVYAAGAAPDDDPSAAPVAAFPLDGGDQSVDGFSFTMTDDGDGLFGSGDTFQVTGPGDEFEVVVWDLWADRDVQDNPTPGPALPLLALALLGAALARRR